MVSKPVLSPKVTIFLVCFTQLGHPIQQEQPFAANSFPSAFVTCLLSDCLLSFPLFTRCFLSQMPTLLLDRQWLPSRLCRFCGLVPWRNIPWCLQKVLLVDGSSDGWWSSVKPISNASLNHQSLTIDQSLTISLSKLPGIWVPWKTRASSTLFGGLEEVR